MQGEDEETGGQPRPDPPPMPSSGASTGAILAWLEGSAWRLRLLESDASFDSEVVAREAGQWEQRLRSLVRSGLHDYASEVVDELGCAGVSTGYQWVDGSKPGVQVALARGLAQQQAGNSRAVLEWNPGGWALRASGLRFMPGETAFPTAADTARWVADTLRDPPPALVRESTMRTRWIADVLHNVDQLEQLASTGCAELSSESFQGGAGVRYVVEVAYQVQFPDVVCRDEFHQSVTDTLAGDTRVTGGPAVLPGDHGGSEIALAVDADEPDHALRSALAATREALRAAVGGATGVVVSDGVLGCTVCPDGAGS